jgi:[protein-PII] uridylyltransferase
MNINNKTNETMLNKRLNDLLCNKAEELVKNGFDGISVANQLTSVTDNILVSIYEDSVPAKYPIVLLAVGGYGRREICPFSDIDIMILCRNKDSETKEIVKSFFYKLWDCGLNISHSVRTFDECLFDSKDLITRISFLDSRFVFGDINLFNEYKKNIYPKLILKNRKDFIRDIFNFMDRRHKKYGDSIYLLEPNIKEGRGGLRDIQCISWIAGILTKNYSLESLKNILSYDYKHFINAYNLILGLRACLHFLTKRKNDILSFEYQDKISKLLGFKDTNRFFSSEILLRLFYNRSQKISLILSMLRKKFGAELYDQFNIFKSKIERINSDFFLLNNEITVSDKDIFKSGDKIMEAFYIYATSGRNFNNQTLDLIRRNFLNVNKKTRISKKAITFFLHILKSNRVYETLKEMHGTGILDRFIPEFGRLRNLVIHEPYHRYTVDEHTLIAIKSFEIIKNSKNSKFQTIFNILSNYGQEIFFLSILLHDLGKSYLSHSDSDVGHEDYGYIMLKSVMERLNIPYQDRRKIELIVKNHTLLSKYAFSRDMDEPETIAHIADIAENEENLSALYLITYSDMKALNPNFMTDWKKYLLDSLYHKTMKYLKGIKDYPLEIKDSNLKNFVKRVPERYLLSNTLDAVKRDLQLIHEYQREGIGISIDNRFDGSAQLTIVAEDSPGLFLKILYVLRVFGLSIHSARLYTLNEGIVIDKIILSNWSAIWWMGLEDMLKDDLKKIIYNKNDKNLFKITQKNIFNYDERRLLLRRHKSFIEIDNEISDNYSIIEIFTADRVGLLFDLCSRFCEFELNIASAIINTEDNVAYDVFYVQQNSQKLSGQKILNVLNGLWETIKK